MSETIVSVDRALDILILLYDNGQGMGVSEISRDLDLHKSTVHRTLATLENKSFVYQNKDNGKYWLGLKIYAMGLLVGEKLSLTDIIKPYAKQLFEEFHEVVNVSILDKDVNKEYKSVIIMKESESRNVLSVNPNVGSSSDAHSSSVGKCLLAFTDDVNIEEYAKHSFKKYTDNTIANYDELVAELKEIREKGYSVDNEEQEIGLYCIGAPIFDRKGNTVAAISISGPTARMKNDEIGNKISRLTKVANEISLVVREMQ